MFGLLHTHRLVFQGCREAGGGVSSFAFVPEQPFEAKAGQHGFLQLGGTTRKPFSLASAPEEGSVLIGTSLLSGSSFKQRLAALRPGDMVTLRGPVNQFTLDGVAPHRPCPPESLRCRCPSATPTCCSGTGRSSSTPAHRTPLLRSGANGVLPPTGPAGVMLRPLVRRTVFAGFTPQIGGPLAAADVRRRLGAIT